jgi:microsomal dipeptidase-like Zn-dependent dipeptidase
VRVALSTLYLPFAEMDLSVRYESPPSDDYFAALLNLIAAVNASISARPRQDAVIARDFGALERGLANKQVVLVHAVEGGFHLGDEAGVADNVKRLADEFGVAYITVAHLFHRQVATNVPALPFMSDERYKQLFQQPNTGLDPLGVAMVRAMVAEGVIVDITHMSRLSVKDTFDLLNQLDPARTVPVMATHTACAFGEVDYNIHPDHIQQVAERKGVIGLIACEHWMSIDRPNPADFEDSIQTLFDHIDCIKKVTGEHSFTAIGSDMDGFIKPPLPGIETPRDYCAVEAALSAHYGPAVAEMICSGNALRVLKAGWGVKHG